jgi:hypothetical protein
MTAPTNPQELFSPFLEATFNIPEEDDRLKPFLNDKLSALSDVVNDKKIGGYVQSAENFNGEKWSFDTTKKVRNGYQSVARITSFVPQTIPMPIGNIHPQFVITHVWGSASKPCTAVGAGDGDYFSFFAQGDARIQFIMTDTQITITTDGARASYQGFIVIEYLRDGI